MYDVDGHLNYVRYNVNAVVGLMGWRTNGLSNHWAVGPPGSYLLILAINSVRACAKCSEEKY